MVKKFLMFTFVSILPISIEECDDSSEPCSVNTVSTIKYENSNLKTLPRIETRDWASPEFNLPRDYEIFKKDYSYIDNVNYNLITFSMIIFLIVKCMLNMRVTN